MIILNRAEYLNNCWTRRRIDRKMSEKLKKHKIELLEFFKRINLVSSKVLDAFIRVPRECFVPPEFIKYAYIDEPLPISENATISAISMSLLMCEYAKLNEGDYVFEVGTGSGYQAALIAELVYPKDNLGNLIRKGPKLVFSAEIDETVYKFGKQNLEITGYLNFVNIKLHDGTTGWPEEIKFDAIIVTAAGKIVPPPLINQLKIGGRLIMPLGTGMWQSLIRLIKTGKDEGDYKIEYLEDVRFVELRGKYGHKK